LYKGSKHPLIGRFDPAKCGRAPLHRFPHAPPRPGPGRSPAVRVLHGGLAFRWLRALVSGAGLGTARMGSATAVPPAQPWNSRALLLAILPRAPNRTPPPKHSATPPRTGLSALGAGASDAGGCHAAEAIRDLAATHPGEVGTSPTALQSCWFSAAPFARRGASLARSVRCRARSSLARPVRCGSERHSPAAPLLHLLVQIGRFR